MSRRPSDNPPTRTRIAKWLGVAVVFVGSGVLVARSIMGDRITDSEPEDPIASVKVSHVYSGNRVKLKSDRHLTYAGIRAPYKGEPYFDEATKRNAELLEGQKIRLRFDEAESTDGETLNGYAFADGVFVNERLVSDGLAYVRLTTTNQRFAKELLDAQREARRKRRGLWREPEPESESIYVGDPKYGNFHRASCEQTSKIKPERRIEFNSRRIAFDKGFAPCTKCKP